MKKMYYGLVVFSSLLSAQSLDLVKDINVGGSGSSISNFTVLGDKLYFQATNGTTTGTGFGAELWSSDGTEGETAIVQDYIAGTNSFSPTNIKAFGDKLFFQGTGATSVGYELYSYDTSNGIQLFADIAAGAGSSFPSNFTEFQGNLYFKANGKLYVTNGVTAPAIANGASATFLSTSTVGWTGIAALTDKILFGGGASSTNLQLYSYDGIESKLVKTINASATSSINNLYKATDLGKVFFLANNGTNGSEPWVSDGTAEGTYMIKDINVGSGNSLSSPTFIEFNSKVYFPATNGTDGTELWVTDGTEAGTSIVKDIYEGTSGSSPASFVVYGNKLYFVASTPSEGRELWETDGTADGTKLVKDFVSGTSGSNLSTIIVFKDELYSFGSNGVSSVGAELMKINLTIPSLDTANTFKERLMIFPNPSNGNFNLNVKENVTYEIFDLNGRLVLKGKTLDGKINSQLLKGQYIIKVSGKEKNSSSKIMINK